MKTSRWPVSHLPISGVTPFTYRDGETYLSLLHRLAQYVTEQLHPNLRKTVEHMVEEMEHILAAQHGKYVEGIQDFHRIHDAFMTDVNSTLMALNDSAVGELANDPASAFGRSLRDVVSDGINQRVVPTGTTYNIPADFPTLQDALDHISTLAVPSGNTITVNFQAGHQPSTGATIRDANLDNVLITSSEPVVVVSNTFTGSFLEGFHCSMPRLGTIIDMRGRGVDGYSVREGSTGYVYRHCGIRNAGSRGCYVVQNSHVHANTSEFTGAYERNLWISRTSSFEGELGNFSGNNGGDNAVYVSRGSTINILDADVSNAFKNGITLVRSTGTIQGCDVSNANGDGVIAGAGSRVSGKYVVANNCSGFGANIREGSSGDLGFSDFSGAGLSGLVVRDAATVDARRIIATDCGEYGVLANTMGTVNVSQADIRGNSIVDARVTQGGAMNLHRASTTNGDPSPSDTIPSVHNEYTANGIIHV